MWRHFVLLCIFIAAFPAMPLRGEQMPQIAGESLSGKQVSLPSAVSGSVAIIFIGFSHASQSQLKPWRERTTHEFRQNARVRVYSIAVLQDAPRLIRGMIVRGMKNGVPAEEHSRFLVVYHGESELKRITGFNGPGQAYMLLLDPKGEIVWRHRGPVTDAAFKELSDRVDAILRSE
jgi:hypothetical protein